MSDEAPYASSLWIRIFGVYLILLNLTLVVCLLLIWPSHEQGIGGPIVLLEGNLTLSFSAETRYLLVTALAGALGSYIHLTTSFIDYVGNRKFVTSWGWWYILRPFIGMALALIIYFVIRGGLIAPGTTAEGLSLYGIAAISGLSGMFSKQATDKLKEVFDNLFRTSQAVARKDAADSEEASQNHGD